MIETPRLRAATSADKDFLWQLYCETMRAPIEQVWGWDESWRRRRFEEDLAACRVRVIHDEGRPVGSIWSTDTDDSVYVTEFQVLPEFQSKGIGTAVLKDVIAEAASRTRDIELSVLSINMRARALYERLGFYVRAREDPFFHMRRLAVRMATLETERLILRDWRPDDREPFARMEADPRVVELLHAPTLATSSEVDALISRIHETIDRRGFGFWAVEIPGVASFAGFIGLTVPRFEAAFTPRVEIGWRLAADVWNRGYATEGARAALAYGFDALKLSEIVAYTVPANTRSRRVMEKLGMARDLAGDFNHPNFPEGHPLRRHVLYRIKAG